MATEQNFRVVRGETVTVDFRITRSGLPVNLTTYVIIWQLTTLITKSTAAGTITLTVPLDGWARFTLTAAETLQLQEGGSGYKHECKVKDTLNNVSQVFYGRVVAENTLIPSI